MGAASTHTAWDRFEQYEARAHATTPSATPPRQSATTTTPPAAAARQAYAAGGIERFDRVRDTAVEFLQGRVSQTTPGGSALADRLVSYLDTVEADHGLRPQLGGGLRTPPGGSTTTPGWYDDALEDAYRAGITDAREQATTALRTSLPDIPADTRLQRPAHAGRLRTLRDEQAQLWRRLTTDLNGDVAQNARQALTENASLDDVVDTLDDRITHLGKHRAQLIGDHEAARAYHSGTLSEYELLGADEARLDANWTTAGDTNVCARCRSGPVDNPYRIENAHGLLPHHPHCRCRWRAVQADFTRPPR